MGAKEDYDKAYAKGREDGAKPGQGDIDPLGLIIGVATAGMSVAAGLDPAKNNYDPPKGDAAKAAYERGWKDEKGKK